MILNRIEFALMNNPVRAGIQRYIEVPRMLRLGGPIAPNSKALEIGCGRGVGVEVILDHFGATSVDAFDLDPRMVESARSRLASRGDRVRLWVGDATSIEAPDACYDAVFDFGIIHHIPDWRKALSEVYRVLKPGGVFYVEEVLKALTLHPVIKRLLKHPEEDRFDLPTFTQALREAGFEVMGSEGMLNVFAWLAARKPKGESP